MEWKLNKKMEWKIKTLILCRIKYHDFTSQEIIWIVSYNKDILKKKNCRLWGSHLSPAMFDFFKRKNTNNLEGNGDDLMLPSSSVDVPISKNPQNFFFFEKIPPMKVDELTLSLAPLL